MQLYSAIPQTETRELRTPAYAPVPLSLLEARRGKPRGMLADVGGSLAGEVSELHRQGWVVHMSCMDPERIKIASRNGVRAAYRAPLDNLPFADKLYSAAVLALPDLTKLDAALAEITRICHPHSLVIMTTSLRNGADRIREAFYDHGMVGTVLPSAEGQLLAVHAGNQPSLYAS